MERDGVKKKKREKKRNTHKKKMKLRLEEKFDILLRLDEKVSFNTEMLLFLVSLNNLTETSRVALVSLQ